eukprot:1194262-Prorocentrum_minimum.AAC.3
MVERRGKTCELVGVTLAQTPSNHHLLDLPVSLFLNCFEDGFDALVLGLLHETALHARPLSVPLTSRGSEGRHLSHGLYAVHVQRFAKEYMHARFDGAKCAHGAQAYNSSVRTFRYRSSLLLKVGITPSYVSDCIVSLLIRRRVCQLVEKGRRSLERAVQSALLDK